MWQETKTRKSPHDSAKVFKVRIQVKCTSELVTINDVTHSMKVETLKDKIETEIGIPGSQLQLSYLDKSYMSDDYNISYFHILPNAKLSLTLFQPLHNIVAACYQQNLKKLMETLPLNDEELSDWNQKFIYFAAFYVCHHGYSGILEKLLETNVNVKNILKSGRHPLSVAVDQVGRRIRVHEWTKCKAALSNWEIQEEISAQLERKKPAIKYEEDIKTNRLTAAAMLDSKLITWFDGPFSTRYMCVILEGKKERKTESRKPIFKP